MRPLLPRLAFGNATAQVSSNLDAFLAAQRAVMPAIRRYDPLDNRREFSHHSVVLGIGDIRLVASASTPVSVSVADSPETTMLIPFYGWSTSVINGREHRWQAGATAMFLPGTGRDGRSGLRSVLGITFQPAQLLATVRAMLGPRGADRLTLDLQTPRLIQINGSRSPVMPMLRQVLPLIDLGGCDESNLRLLGIDEMLRRLIAVMLAPEILAPVFATHRSCRSAAVMRRVTDYIMGHLPDVITLSDLERISGFSARSLQLAFRREYNCSPREWIQTQRLLMARERLMTARPEDSVTRVALACGFTRFGSFAAAYARRFGETPSTTLSRRRQG